MYGTGVAPRNLDIAPRLLRPPPGRVGGGFLLPDQAVSLLPPNMGSRRESRRFVSGGSSDGPSATVRGGIGAACSGSLQASVPHSTPLRDTAPAPLGSPAQGGRHGGGHQRPTPLLPLPPGSRGKAGDLRALRRGPMSSAEAPGSCSRAPGQGARAVVWQHRPRAVQRRKPCPPLVPKHSVCVHIIPRTHRPLKNTSACHFRGIIALLTYPAKPQPVQARIRRVRAPRRASRGSGRGQYTTCRLFTHSPAPKSPCSRHARAVGGGTTYSSWPSLHR